jgi:ATP-binding protein involved in chromosome partitioning
MRSRTMTVGFPVSSPAMPVAPEALVATLDMVVEPDLNQGLDAAGCVKAIHPGAVPAIEIELGYPAASRHAALVAAVKAAVRAAHGIDCEVRLTTDIRAETERRNVQGLPGIRNILAVASGKGGVGKSTVAANVALALAAEGARVGLLDADIYGPSQPLMMGVPAAKPVLVEQRTMLPVAAHGVHLMSIGFLVDERQPMVWRGPMASQALSQLLHETRWPELDYLVLDLPPGTGDIQLSIAQKMPVAGAIVVTTPQDIALLDAKKGLAMFEKVGVPVLGVVENMAVHVCSQCGHAEHLFGEGGGARLAAEAGTEVLGSLPLKLSIRQQMDAGQPTVVAAPESPEALAYRGIARRAAARLAHGAPADDFPSIEIE